MIVRIIIEKRSDEDMFAAYSPALPGCFARGRTASEARRKIREIVRQRVEGLMMEGRPVPADEDVLRVENVAVNVRRGRARSRRAGPEGRP